jgi:segregation and condensation protein B
LDHFGLGSLKDLPGIKELRAAGLLENRPAPGVLMDNESEESELDVVKQSDMFDENE